MNPSSRAIEPVSNALVSRTEELGAESIRRLPFLGEISRLLSGMQELQSEFGSRMEGTVAPIGPKWAVRGGIVVYPQGPNSMLFENEVELDGNGQWLTGTRFRQLAFVNGELSVAHFRYRDNHPEQLFVSSTGPIGALTACRLRLSGASTETLRAELQKGFSASNIRLERGFYFHYECQDGELKALWDLLRADDSGLSGSNRSGRGR